MVLFSVLYDREVKPFFVFDPDALSAFLTIGREPQSESSMLLFNTIALVHVTLGLLGVLRVFSLAVLKKEHPVLNNYFCVRNENFSK